MNGKNLLFIYTMAHASPEILAETYRNLNPHDRKYSYYDTVIYEADRDVHKLTGFSSRQKTVDLTDEKIYVSFEDLSFFTKSGNSPPSVNDFRDYLVAQLVAVRNTYIIYNVPSSEEYKTSNDFECEFRIPARSSGDPDKFFVLNFDLNKIYDRSPPYNSINFKKLRYIVSDEMYRIELQPRDNVYKHPKTNPPEYPTTEEKTLVIEESGAKSEEKILSNRTYEPPATSVQPDTAKNGWRIGRIIGWGGQRKPVKRSRKIFKNIKSKRSRKYRKYLRNKR